MAEAAPALIEFPSVDTPVAEVRRPWPLPARLAYRFFSVYFALYVVCTQMLNGMIPFQINVPNLSDQGPVRWMVEWTARNAFGVTAPLVVTGSGSGDKTFDWVMAFCLLMIAAAITAAWSLMAKAGSYDRGHARYRLFLRFALGTTMLTYGAVKLIPLQMPFPSLQRLLEPYGHFSPMGVLWASIGASRPYEIFTGAAETTAAILLFIPATAPLGALVALACTIQVFMLNMTYDVPVKLFSFHLILMSAFLLAPDCRRILGALLAAPASRPRRAALVLQVVLGAWFVAVALKGSADAWWQYGGGAPKSPLYGVWNVAYMSIDGIERAALVTDHDRWRRVIFDRPQGMAFQRMDDTFAPHGNTIDISAKTITLSRGADPKWGATFTYEQPSPDRLALSGTMDGKAVVMRLELFPRERFLLVTRGFHWIQEYPFNR
jgi:hypothetical protein